MVSILSPFRWRETPRPSIFLMDSAFYKGARTGMTMNAIQSEAMTRFEQENGRSAGTIYGISDKADKQAAARPRQRSGGHYKREAA